MAKYNVSKKEAKKYGIERKLVGGGGGGSSGGKSSSNTSKQFEKLQKEYQKSIQPTTEETTAEKQLSNLITSRELGIAKAEAEPMPQSFVTGQSTALAKATALKAMPLETQLANLKSKRQVSSDTLRTSLDFLKDQMAIEQAEESESYQRDLSERQFQEGIRQFNVSESRRGSSGGSGGTDKETNEFEKEAKSLADQVFSGKMNRETAKRRLMILFPDFDENVIYDLVPDFYENE